MVRLLLASLSLTALVLAGCATTQTSSADSIEISSTYKTSCKKIGDLQLTCASRSRLETAIRKDAASKGANYVQVTSLKVGSLTGRVRVTGLALSCPQKKAVRLEDFPVLSAEELEAAVRPLDSPARASKENLHSSNKTGASSVATRARVATK